jgi:hypothetical protein
MASPGASAQNASKRAAARGRGFVSGAGIQEP